MREPRQPAECKADAAAASGVLSQPANRSRAGPPRFGSLLRSGGRPTQRVLRGLPQSWIRTLSRRQQVGGSLLATLHLAQQAAKLQMRFVVMRSAPDGFTQVLLGLCEIA